MTDNLDEPKVIEEVLADVETAEEVLDRPEIIIEYHMVYEPTNIRQFKCHEKTWEDALKKLYFNFSKDTIKVIDPNAEIVK